MATRVPRLISTDLQGRPYERRADVEQEIQRALALPPSQWPAIATAPVRFADAISIEALVFLIRAARRSYLDLAGRLVEVFSLRAVREAKRVSGSCLRRGSEASHAARAASWPASGFCLSDISSTFHAQPSPARQNV